MYASTIDLIINIRNATKVHFIWGRPGQDAMAVVDGIVVGSLKLVGCDIGQYQRGGQNRTKLMRRIRKVFIEYLRGHPLTFRVERERTRWVIKGYCNRHMIFKSHPGHAYRYTAVMAKEKLCSRYETKTAT